MNSAYEARIPENLDAFVLGLTWFLFFLLAFFAVRWIASKFRRTRQSDATPGTVQQVIHVYHHHVIEIRRSHDGDPYRSQPRNDV